MRSIVLSLFLFTKSARAFLPAPGFLGRCAPAASRTMAAAPGKDDGNRIMDRRAALSIGGGVLGITATVGAGSAAGAAVTIDPSAVQTTKNGVKYVIVKEGACPATDFTGKLGSCFPADGKYAIIDYTAFLPSGQVFDTTEKKGGKPLAFRLGENQVIPGLEEVLKYMKPGEEVQALIPAALAYGSKGVCTEAGECLVPPGSNLKYYVKLIRVTAASG